MLDAFKKSGKPSRSRRTSCEALIATSREERAALSTMLTQMQLQAPKLATAGKSLQEVEEKAGKAHARLDDVTERLAKADARAKELEAIDARIKALTRCRRTRPSRKPRRLTAPDGELQKHKQALQSLRPRRCRPAPASTR